MTPWGATDQELSGTSQHDCTRWGTTNEESNVAPATVKAWQSFAHKQDEQALQQLRESADNQDRVGQSEVDDRPAEALAEYRTALQLSPNRYNGLYNADRAAKAIGKPDEALNYYSQLMKVTNVGVNTHRPEVSYVLNYIQKPPASGL
jgi:tetratricopeptide (TPR) repeat protein